MRYLAVGYKVIAITDHADYSNIGTAVKSILDFTRHWPKNSKIRVLPGIELTHLPVTQFKPLALYARRQGIKIIVAHGETPVEPVATGTNRSALEADIDILAHPGMITQDDAVLAGKKGIFLEITSRRGHRDTNAYVARRALKAKARLILNNDSHMPEDIITPERLKGFGIKAGLSVSDVDCLYRGVEEFLKRKKLL